jgi:hypothetical protein
MEVQRNKGYVEKKPNGYFGTINIENIKFDIVCTFWSRPSMIWIKRVKAKKYDHIKNTFEEYEPRPYFDCKAKRVSKDSSSYYDGSFMLVGIKYNLVAYFEDRKERLLNITVKRSEEQPYIERMKEINNNNVLLNY